MKRTHWGQHDDCFPCRALSVSFSPSAMPTRSPQAVEIDAREKRWEKDMPAYQRLKRDGIQPNRLDGSAEMEKKAVEKFEIERGTLVANPEHRARMGEYIKEMA